MRTLVFMLGFCFFSQASAQQALETDLPHPSISAPVPTTSSSPAISASSNTDPLSVITIPARTPLRFTLETSVSSKTSLPGEQFQLKVAEDLIIDGIVAIPSGTEATGEVIHAQKSSVFGKAGELLLTIRFVDLHGQKIRMRLFQALQGRDDSRKALAVTIIPGVGLFAPFIRGGEIEIPKNTLFQALVASDNIVRLPKIVNDTNTTSFQNSTSPTNGDSQ